MVMGCSTCVYLSFTRVGYNPTPGKACMQNQKHLTLGEMRVHAKTKSPQNASSSISREQLNDKLRSPIEPTNAVRCVARVSTGGAKHRFVLKRSLQLRGVLV